MQWKQMKPRYFPLHTTLVILFFCVSQITENMQMFLKFVVSFFSICAIGLESSLFIVYLFVCLGFCCLLLWDFFVVCLTP